MLETSQFVIQSLLQEGQLSDSDHARAVEHAARGGHDLTASLVQLGIVSSRDLAITRARICEYPFVELKSYDIDIRHSKLLPQRVAERLVAFPLFVMNGMATVAMEDPLHLQSIDQLHQMLRMQIEPVLCDADELRSLIARAYSMSSGHLADSATDQDTAEDLGIDEEPVVVATKQILRAAADCNASDIHINPDEDRLHLRYRIDGILQQQQGPDLSMHCGIVQRLKVLAQLDLTETRRPQDGKFRFIHRDQPIDVRLSVLPTVHGENVVLRLLRPAVEVGSIRDLHMPDGMATMFEDLLAKPYGMIAVTGPTGSGKTTTLYTAIGQINTPERNIVTIEDPVEIRMPLVRQVQVNNEIGMTFATALRSILRQDPDVILVGEIRDNETAHIAIQSAMTGHLVLTTLHTNDAVGSLARLRDLGVPPFAINNGLLGVLAQRLVRRVCESCAIQRAPEPEIRRALGLGDDCGEYAVGDGCSACMGTGYRGRLGVFEMFRLDWTMKELIEREAPQTEIHRAAVASGMTSMIHDGLSKAARGLTSLEEVIRLGTINDDFHEEARLAA